jgi:hypothetical protein
MGCTKISNQEVDADVNVTDRKAKGVSPQEAAVWPIDMMNF